MPKALFFNVPGHGHINPSLPLVRELVVRGHEITYFATEKFRVRIQETGADTRIYPQVEDDYFEKRGLHGGVPQKVACALLTTTGDLLPYLLEVTQEIQPDYIIYDSMCTWGYFVAQKLNLPSVVSMALIPIAPRALLDWRVLRWLIPVILREFGNGITANRLSQTLCKQYGVKPLGGVQFMDVPGSLRLSYTIADFVPFAETLPNNLRFVGWTMRDSATDDPFVHDPTRKLIYISLGTVNNDNAGFFKMCIAAFTDTDYEVLITTGHRFSATDFGTLPANITVTQWVTQEQVIRHAALFINHGGANSIHDSLYAGVPLLLVPQQGEQTMNSTRVVELGAGLMLSKTQLSAQTLLSHASRLLIEPEFKIKAQQFGAKLRSAGGAVRAADEVELLLKRTIAKPI